MKIGSVKFFKRLILSTVFGVLAILLALAVLFGVLYQKEKNRVQQLEEVNAIMLNAIQTIMALNPTLSAEEEELLESLLPQEGGQQVLPSMAYQSLYPALYAPQPGSQTAEDMVCYLTFDDGPSPTTEKVLQVLDTYGIKATFFVTGEASEEYGELIQAAAAAGHTIGVHTYSHDYAKIYASVEAYLDDFNLMYTRVEELTGVKPTVFRFPGGSVNVHNAATYTPIAAEMLRRGFVFYDWNAAGSDAVKGGISAAQVTKNVLASAEDKQRLIVLLHDRPDTSSSAAALPAIIEGLQAKGFRFEALTPQVMPITYYVSN